VPSHHLDDEALARRAIEADDDDTTRGLEADEKATHTRSNGSTDKLSHSHGGGHSGSAVGGRSARYIAPSAAPVAAGVGEARRTDEGDRDSARAAVHMHEHAYTAPPQPGAVHMKESATAGSPSGERWKSPL
jgi:hypothetical protein